MPKPKRKVLYQKVFVELCNGVEEPAITVAKAKGLLGWLTETEERKFGPNHLLKDERGVAVRCLNNITNRPLYRAVLETLQQEILRHRWQFNGETVIIGRTGLVLNGQHTLIALVLASQEIELHPDRWSDDWTTEPTAEKLLVYGVDESDKVVNTMDTCKPRILADVIYRSHHFADMGKKSRRKVSRLLDYAVRLLWFRTGVGLDAFAPRCTHAEALDFIERHPRLLDCVKHIYAENGDSKINFFVSPGYASALLYLMGSSNSEPTDYYRTSSPNEKTLNWKHWDQACDFWVSLAHGADELSAVRRVLVSLQEEDTVSNAKRWALLVKAWQSYLSEKRLTTKSLSLLRHTHEDGTLMLAECPVTGGIDLGLPTAEDKPTKTDPSEGEIQKLASVEREKRNGDKAKVSKPKQDGVSSILLPKRAGKTWAKGDVAWVVDREEGKHYLGTLTVEPFKADDGVIWTEVRATDGDWEEKVSDLSFANPKMKTKPRKSKPGKLGLKAGLSVWVNEPSGDHWQGRIVDYDGKEAKLKVMDGHLGAGNVETVPLDQLQKEQPV